MLRERKQSSQGVSDTHVLHPGIIAGVQDALEPGMRHEMVAACVCIVAKSYDPSMHPGSLLIIGEPQPLAQCVLNHGWVYLVGLPQQLITWRVRWWHLVHVIVTGYAIAWTCCSSTLAKHHSDGGPSVEASFRLPSGATLTPSSHKAQIALGLSEHTLLSRLVRTFYVSCVCFICSSREEETPDPTQDAGRRSKGKSTGGPASTRRTQNRNAKKDIDTARCSSSRRHNGRQTELYNNNASTLIRRRRDAQQLAPPALEDAHRLRAHTSWYVVAGTWYVDVDVGCTMAYGADGGWLRGGYLLDRSIIGGGIWLANGCPHPIGTCNGWIKRLLKTAVRALLFFLGEPGPWRWDATAGPDGTGALAVDPLFVALLRSDARS
eukprot:scaffold2693_cov139-Isochrysis_galbana.AAC.9